MNLSPESSINRDLRGIDRNMARGLTLVTASLSLGGTIFFNAANKTEILTTMNSTGLQMPDGIFYLANMALIYCAFTGLDKGIDATVDAYLQYRTIVEEVRENSLRIRGFFLNRTVTNEVSPSPQPALPPGSD